MSWDCFPLPLPRPGTKWRRRQVDAEAAVFKDSLADAGLWPFKRWGGKIDRYGYLFTYDGNPFLKMIPR